MPKPVANSPFLVCFSVELFRLNHGKPKLSDSVVFVDFHTIHLRFDHLYNKNLRFSPFSDAKFQKNCFVKAKLQAATEELRITEAGRPNQPCEKLVLSTENSWKPKVWAIYNDQTAEVTPNGGLVRETPQNGLKLG